jgi:transglutaminase-like putative cysteine protease
MRRGDRTASEGHEERRGVCRDFAHLAVTLSRCMIIPARYCTGYLGDIGVPVDPAPMDFSAWYEVFLEGRWFTFDARHNHPRIGRIVIAKGRDAADVAISTAFGPAQLAPFKVVTDELEDKEQDTAEGSRLIWAEVSTSLVAGPATVPVAVPKWQRNPSGIRNLRLSADSQCVSHLGAAASQGLFDAVRAVGGGLMLDFRIEFGAEQDDDG